MTSPRAVEDYMEAALRSPALFASALSNALAANPERATTLYRHLLAMVRFHRRGEWHVTGALIEPWIEDWSRQQAISEEVHFAKDRRAGYSSGVAGVVEGAREAGSTSSSTPAHRPADYEEKNP